MIQSFRHLVIPAQVSIIMNDQRNIHYIYKEMFAIRKYYEKLILHPLSAVFNIRYLSSFWYVLVYAQNLIELFERNLGADILYI